MNNAPQITRRQLPSGKFRYEVNGEVHTAKSGRLYTHASVYRRVPGAVEIQEVGA